MAEKRYCKIDGGLLCYVRFLNRFVCNSCGIVYEAVEDSQMKPGIADPKECLEARLKKMEEGLLNLTKSTRQAVINSTVFGGQSGSDSEGD